MKPDSSSKGRVAPATGSNGRTKCFSGSFGKRSESALSQTRSVPGRQMGLSHLRRLHQRVRRRFPEERFIADRKASQLVEPVVLSNRTDGRNPTVSSQQVSARRVVATQVQNSKRAQAEALAEGVLERPAGDAGRATKVAYRRRCRVCGSQVVDGAFQPASAHGGLDTLDGPEWKREGAVECREQILFQGADRVRVVERPGVGPRTVEQGIECCAKSDDR